MSAIGTASSISPLAAVIPGTMLGPGAVVEEFCLIGRPAEGAASEPARIGAGARLRSHTVLYAGSRIGDRFQTGHHVLVRHGNTIGENVSIGSLSVVEHHVTIEDGVRIHSQCFLPEYTVLRENAWIGPRVTVTNAPFPRCPEVFRCMRGVTVAEGARVGANVTILPGVTIGAGALIWAQIVERVAQASGTGRVVTSEHDILDGIALSLRR